MAGRPRKRAREAALKSGAGRLSVDRGTREDSRASAESLIKTDDVSRELALREESVREYPDRVPSERDDEFWEGIFDEIRSGATLVGICRRTGYGMSVMQRRLHSERLSGRYAAAHEGRAVMHVQKIEGLLEELERGGIDSDVAKVSIDARKWLATKYYPRMFGERQQIDVKTTDMTKVYVEQLKLVMKSQEERLRVIEGVSE